MRYFIADKSIQTPFGDITKGQLITEREAAKSKQRDIIHAECRLIQWPAKDTMFAAGIRYRMAKVPAYDVV